MPYWTSSLATTVWPPIAPARLIQPRASSSVTSDVAGRGHRRAARRLGDGQAEDTEPFICSIRPPGSVGVLELADDGLDLAVDELTDRLDEKGLFLIQTQGHGDTSADFLV